MRVSGDCRSFLLGIILKPALEARKRKGGKEGALAVETARLKLVRSCSPCRLCDALGCGPFRYLQSLLDFSLMRPESEPPVSSRPDS